MDVRFLYIKMLISQTNLFQKSLLLEARIMILTVVRKTILINFPKHIIIVKALAMAIAVAFLLLLLASPTAYAVNYVVVDTSGWSQGVDYSTWKNIQCGRHTLSMHGVDEVIQSDYNICATGDALNSYSDCNTTITLSKAGSMYFICPTTGHCASGMKLAGSVVSASGTPSSSSPPPLSNSTTPSGSTTPPSTTPSPTKSNAAARASGLVVGFMLILGSGLAIMGQERGSADATFLFLFQFV
ncbi:hypothetical protein SLEP1_g23840 [Rubroshorea leprosula]|uniref:Phytocyanin domain-containing protein n=1 Tax=Rubroshorea leprosula TaxID=152421 RepID=A0AAV5JMX8_9ROSI|nr:hypothetical protein SLEP1_g23840 [Rubroshorea leprosula]